MRKARRETFCSDNLWGTIPGLQGGAIACKETISTSAGWRQKTKWTTTTKKEQGIGKKDKKKILQACIINGEKKKGRESPKPYKKK